PVESGGLGELGRGRWPPGIAAIGVNGGKDSLPAPAGGSPSGESPRTLCGSSPARGSWFRLSLAPSLGFCSTPTAADSSSGAPACPSGKAGWLVVGSWLSPTFAKPVSRRW